MKKTYQGSCHCGAVRYECELDLAEGTTRCNCRFCQKARFWMAFVKARDFRLLQGGELLTDYQHVAPPRTAPFPHFAFCSRCGVRPFTRGGALARFEGEFYAVNVACLEGLTAAELAEVPVQFADGRNDAWENTPQETRYL